MFKEFHTKCKWPRVWVLEWKNFPLKKLSVAFSGWFFFLANSYFVYWRRMNLMALQLWLVNWLNIHKLQSHAESYHWIEMKILVEKTSTGAETFEHFLLDFFMCINFQVFCESAVTKRGQRGDYFLSEAYFSIIITDWSIKTVEITHFRPLHKIRTYYDAWVLCASQMMH